MHRLGAARRRGFTLALDVTLRRTEVSPSAVHRFLTTTTESAAAAAAEPARESTALTVYRPRTTAVVAYERPASALTVYRPPAEGAIVVRATGAPPRALDRPRWVLDEVLGGAAADPLAPSAGALVPVVGRGGGGGGGGGRGADERWRLWRILGALPLFGAGLATALALYTVFGSDDPEQNRLGRRYFAGFLDGILTPTNYLQLRHLPARVQDLPIREITALWEMTAGILGHTERTPLSVRLAPLYLPLENISLDETRVRALAHRLVELSFSAEVTHLGAPSFEQIQRAIASTGWGNWAAYQVGFLNEDRIHGRARAAVARLSAPDRALVVSSGVSARRDELVGDWAAYLTGKLSGTTVISALLVSAVRRGLELGTLGSWMLTLSVMGANMLTTIGGFNYHYQQRREKNRVALRARGFSERDADEFARLLGLSPRDVGEIEEKLVRDVAATEAYRRRVGADLGPARLIVRRGLFVIFKIYQENLPPVVDHRLGSAASADDNQLSAIFWPD